MLTRNSATTSRLLLTLLALASPAFAQQRDTSPAERLLFELTNEIRVQHHLAPFGWNPALARAAHAHAQQLAQQPGPLEHQYPGEPDLVTRAAAAGARFGTVSENLARGNTGPAELEDLWTRTPVHRANLLSPTLDTIGIGVVARNGFLYAVQDFARAVPLLDRSAIEQQVAQELQHQGLKGATATDVARAACDEHSASAHSTITNQEARLIVQWEGSEPTTLPEPLLAQLRRASFRAAEIGACSITAQPTGFTTARVAVLLF